MFRRMTNAKKTKAAATPSRTPALIDAQKLYDAKRDKVRLAPAAMELLDDLREAQPRATYLTGLLLDADARRKRKGRSR